MGLTTTLFSNRAVGTENIRGNCPSRFRPSFKQKLPFLSNRLELHFSPQIFAGYKREKKSWKPFRIHLLNSTANSANFHPNSLSKCLEILLVPIRLSDLPGALSNSILYWPEFWLEMPLDLPKRLGAFKKLWYKREKKKYPGSRLEFLC